MSRAEFQTWWVENETDITYMLLSLGAAYSNPIGLDDLKSETFLRCWASRPKESQNGYGPWIWTVAKSVIGDALRNAKRARRVSESLAERSMTDRTEEIAIDQLIVRSRIHVLLGLYVEWGNSEEDWDSRLTKRRLLGELIRRIDSDESISRTALGYGIGISGQYVGRLFREIASEILEIENAQM